MKKLSVLIKPASAVCNIRCKYCFYADVVSHREVKSYGKMSFETVELMVNNIYKDLNPGDHITFAFQGGEPTLAGVKYYQEFVAYVAEKNIEGKAIVHYAMQTNGMVINDAWCKLFKEHAFLLGLSVDGGASFHDANRVDIRQKGTFHRVMKAKQKFEEYGIEFNILCVLTNQVARHPQQIFDFIIDEQIKHIQFIPCMDELDAEEKSYYALEPERFASFYHTIYLLWKKEYDKGNFIHIGLFDNFISFFQSGIASYCGMLGQCSAQYVIEADGSTFPCDFYVIDAYKTGNIRESTLRELFATPVMQQFLRTKPEKAAMCKTCPFFQICRGGCKRMKNAVYLNKKETFCGYRKFMEQHIDDLSYIAKTM